MAPTDRHPQFNIPFSDAETSNEAKEGNGEWERASTVKPDEEHPQSEHVGNTLPEQKAEHDFDPDPDPDRKVEHDSEPEPETFDKIEITEEDCQSELGFSYPEWKKWTILTVIFLVQISMNFNTSLYSNGLGGISEKFNVSAQAARC